MLQLAANVMSEIRCPSCGDFARTQYAISDSQLEWSCSSCEKTFELRIVFFERPRRVDQARFRKQLRATMASQELTQAELGRMIGVSGAYISTILSGKRRVSPQLAERVSRALERQPGPRPNCNQ